MSTRCQGWGCSTHSLQPGQRDVLLAAWAEDRLLQGSFVLHWPEPTAQQYCHGGGPWRQEFTGKYKCLWVREEGQVSVSLCHKEPRTIGHSPHPWDSETETKLNWSLLGCVSLLCLLWWLHGLHVLILEVTGAFLVLSLQISTSASERGTTAYLDGISWGYIHYSTKISPDSEQAGVKK